MSKTAKSASDYTQITASPIALAKIKSHIDNVDISLVPEEGEDFDLFAGAIASELPSDPDIFNEVMRTITKTSDDFSSMEYNEITIILKSFFDKLGSTYRKLLLKRKRDIEKQRDLATKIMMEKLTKSLMKNGNMEPSMQNLLKGISSEKING